MMFQPIWLVLLLAVPLLVATSWWCVRQWPGATRPARLVGGTRLLLALLAVVIGLHPVGAVRVSVPQETPADIVVLLDRTTSMGAEDFAGDRPRMEGAAADVAQIVQQSAGARIAVVVFDDDARVAVPLTTDATTVTGFLRTVGWRPSAKASGSDVSVGVELTERVLQEAAESRPDHERFLVYVGDGEQTAESAPQSFEPLQERLAGATVLGYGTSKGGRMPDAPDSDDLVELDGQVQVSMIDEELLGTIAEELGGIYLHRTGEEPLPRVVPDVSVPARTEMRPGREYYWMIAIAGAAVLLVLGWAVVGQLRSVREEVARASR